jgi:hypothetical protein
MGKGRGFQNFITPPASLTKKFQMTGGCNMGKGKGFHN